MRTTVTLDADVQRQLSELAHRTGRSFKATLNDTVRRGLQQPGDRRPPPQWPVFRMGAPLVDLTKAAALADELDDRDRQAPGRE